MKKSLLVIILILLIISVFLFFKFLPIRNRIIHISFDDTIDVFLDLYQNEEIYDSIFDNDFLEFLKELHDEYEACFSLYGYNEKGQFNLSMMSNKYSKEFADNASWLKIGFHANSSGQLMNYKSDDTAKTVYNTFINNIIIITGGTSNIDLIPRLERFAGNKSNLEIISIQPLGPIGFLSADDDRNSYYLEGDINKYVDRNDFLIDENGLIFVSTDLRLEKIENPYDELKSIYYDNSQNKIIEVFTHEWAFDDNMKKKLIDVCCFAKEFNYTWDFPMKYFLK